MEIYTGSKNLLNKDFDSPIIEKAMDYAIQCHTDTNHTYNGKPYHIHLKMVYDYGCKFSTLLKPNKIETALAACWVHDTIEDCRQTYNDVAKMLGKEIAEIAYAVTNEKGKTREERANEKYYEGIRNTPAATFVKLCDRLANVDYSRQSNSRMLEVYRKEFENFKSKLKASGLEPMFEELQMLFKE